MIGRGRGDGVVLVAAGDVVVSVCLIVMESGRHSFDHLYLLCGLFVCFLY